MVVPDGGNVATKGPRECSIVVRGGWERRRHLKQMPEPWLSAGVVVVVVVEEQVHRPWGFPCQECSRSCKEAGVAGAE